MPSDQSMDTLLCVDAMHFGRTTGNWAIMWSARRHEAEKDPSIVAFACALVGRARTPLPGSMAHAAAPHEHCLTCTKLTIVA